VCTSYRWSNGNVAAQFRGSAFLRDPVDVDGGSFSLQLIWKWEVFDDGFADAVEEINWGDVQNLRLSHEDHAGFDGTVGVRKVDRHLVGRWNGGIELMIVWCLAKEVKLDDVSLVAKLSLYIPAKSRTNPVAYN
jgi:hypothetical protein